MAFFDYKLLEGLTPLNLFIALGIFLIFLASVFLVRTIIRRLLDRWKSQRQLAAVRTVVLEIDSLIYLAIVVLGAYVSVVSIPVVRDFTVTVERIFGIAAVLLGFFAVVKAQAALFDWYHRRQMRRAAARMMVSVMPLLKRTATTTVVVLGVLVILGQLGVQIAPLLAGLGIAGIAVALALQSTLANFISGVSILSDATVRANDLIELDDGTRGWVKEIGWRATTIRTLDNNIVVMPNSKLAESKTTNYTSGTEEINAIVSYGVGYYTNLRHCREVTFELARGAIGKTDGAIKSFEPFVVFTGFGDSNIDVRVVMRARDWQSKWELTNNFVMDVMERYAEEGIEISFPNRNLWVRDMHGGYLAKGEDRQMLGEPDSEPIPGDLDLEATGGPSTNGPAESEQRVRDMPDAVPDEVDG